MNQSNINKCYLYIIFYEEEELPDPLYYVIDDICSVLHCEAPNHKVIRYYSL